MPTTKRRRLIFAQWMLSLVILTIGQIGLPAEPALTANGSPATIRLAREAGPALTSIVVSGTGPTGPEVQLVPTDDWTKDRFDLSNSGYNPSEDILGPSNVSGLTTAWSAKSGELFGSPAVSRGVLYVTGENSSYPTAVFVSAYDAGKGKRIWRRRLWRAGTLSGVTYHAGALYFGTDDYILHSIDAETGARRWDVPAGGIPTNVTVWNGMVYFQATDAAIHAVDAATGQETWRFSGSALVGLGTPAIARGVLYEGNGQSLYALDARTGQLVWSYETGGLIEASASLWQNTVFVASEDQYLYAINATTGLLRWRVALGPPSFWQDQATAIADGVVYACAQGTLQAFNAVTGALRWKATSATYSGDPVVANGVVYVSGSSSGNLYAVDASDGTNLWTFASGPTHVFEPIVANGMVYFGTPELTAFSLP